MADTSIGLVSVIIPSRNRRARLERAIESVRQQTWPNIEIIVVDDASTDDTSDFLNKLLDYGQPIRIVRNEAAQGGAGARNKGLELAHGEYVAFLDDDDIWLPGKLMAQVALLKRNSDASSVSCSFFVQNLTGKKTVKYVFPPVDVQQILHTNHLGGASMCLARRQMLLDIGGFDAALRSGQDWDLWIKLFDRGSIVVSSDPLVCYMPHEGVRITSNPFSTYSGRRRIFLRYKNRMTSATRRHHLSELLFCRKVMLGRSIAQKITGLCQVIKLSGLIKGLRYVYRYFKSRITA